MLRDAAFWKNSLQRAFHSQTWYHALIRRFCQDKVRQSVPIKQVLSLTDILKDFNKLFIGAASESLEGEAGAYLEPVVVGRDQRGGGWEP